MRQLMAGVLLAAAVVAPQAGAQRDRNNRDDDRFMSRDKWDWSGTLEPGRTVYVRNLNGPIRVEPASGNTLEVSAVKVIRRNGNPSDVQLTAEQRSNHGDVVICAVWTERTRCDEDGYNTRSSNSWFPWGDSHRADDISVEFTVRVPKGVRITASSVNGGLEITGADAEVNAHTVNGSIVARSNSGPVRAHTTNGSLTIQTGLSGSNTLDYQTTNGQITLEFSGISSADVEMRTVNGSISTDFPLTVEGRFTNKRVRGTIGRGGQLVRLSTVNGSIRLRKA
jgi:DUF4097 and DUF4098 domain-containing protein YvlB